MCDFKEKAPKKTSCRTMMPTGKRQESSSVLRRFRGSKLSQREIRRKKTHRQPHPVNTNGIHIAVAPSLESKVPFRHSPNNWNRVPRPDPSLRPDASPNLTAALLPCAFGPPHLPPAGPRSRKRGHSSILRMPEVPDPPSVLGSHTGETDDRSRMEQKSLHNGCAGRSVHGIRG